MCFAGASVTICPNCGKVVPVALGFCVLCDEVFPNSTSVREVAVAEVDYSLPEAA